MAGGKDCATTIRSVIKKIFHNKLVIKFNFAGRVEKVGIKSLRITDATKGIFRYNF